MSEIQQRFLTYGAALAALLQTVYIVSDVVIGTSVSQFEKGQIYGGTVYLIVTGIVLLIAKKDAWIYGAKKNKGTLLLGALLVISLCFPWTQSKLAIMSDVVAVGLWIFLLREEKMRAHFVTVYRWGLCVLVGMGLLQVLTGTVIGSTLWGIAEKNSAEAGVAVVQFNEMRILRAYGFLEHPNNFGAYALLLWMLSRSLLGRKKTVFLSVAVVGIVISLSRTTILSWMIVGGMWWIVGVGALVVVVRFKDYFLETSIGERITQLQQWSEMYKTFAWEGTGVGNYATYVRHYFGVTQGYAVHVVHNTVLLVLSEVGLIKVIAGYAILRKKIEVSALRFFIIPLPMLLFDHFLYATHSGRLWWIGFAVFWYHKKN